MRIEAGCRGYAYVDMYVLNSLNSSSVCRSAAVGYIIIF